MSVLSICPHLSELLCKSWHFIPSPNTSWRKACIRPSTWPALSWQSPSLGFMCPKFTFGLRNLTWLDSRFFRILSPSKSQTPRLSTTSYHQEWTHPRSTSIVVIICSSNQKIIKDHCSNKKYHSLNWIMPYGSYSLYYSARLLVIITLKLSKAETLC